MKVEIKSRWSGAVLFSADLPEETPGGLAMRHALEKAISGDANLSGADLSGANLSGANLSGADLRDANLNDADLSGANLRGANLRGANLSGANLSGANLRGADLSVAGLGGAKLCGANLGDANLCDADLSGANLSGANLSGADLRDANLNDADLSGADLRGANLRGANLSGANLRGANLSDAKNDFWGILLRAPAEIAGLRTALVSGRVDGSTYEGECACLVGTLGKVRGVDYNDLGNGIEPYSNRPAERWFLGIARGDTPRTNQISAITVKWIDEFVDLLNAAKAAS